MPAIFSELFHFPCQIICPLNRILIPIFGAECASSICTRNANHVFSLLSCSRTLLPDHSWLTRLVQAESLSRFQVIDCQGVGLRGTGKNILWQRKLVYGEQKHCADRPKERLWDPEKGRDLSFDFPVLGCCPEPAFTSILEPREVPLSSNKLPHSHSCWPMSCIIFFLSVPPTHPLFLTWIYLFSKKTLY